MAQPSLQVQRAQWNPQAPDFKPLQRPQQQLQDPEEQVQQREDEDEALRREQDRVVESIERQGELERQRLIARQQLQHPLSSPPCPMPVWPIRRLEQPSVQVIGRRQATLLNSDILLTQQQATTELQVQHPRAQIPALTAEQDRMRELSTRQEEIERERLTAREQRIEWQRLGRALQQTQQQWHRER